MATPCSCSAAVPTTRSGLPSGSHRPGDVHVGTRHRGFKRWHRCARLRARRRFPIRTNVKAGAAWQPHWKSLSSGSFVSAPAPAADSLGQNLYVAALGDDFAIWVNHSAGEGGPWDGPRPVGPEPGLLI